MATRKAPRSRRANNQVQRPEASEEIDITISSEVGSEHRSSSLRPPTTAFSSANSGNAVVSDLQFFFDLAPKDSEETSKCKLCLKKLAADPKAKVPNYQYLATTGNTNLRDHLVRHHLEEYWEACNIPSNNSQSWQTARARLSKKRENSATPQEAGKNRLQYSRANFIQSLIEFVVADDQSINVVECPEFRSLLLVLNPGLHDRDIPHRSKLKSDMIYAWASKFKQLKDELAASAGKISFTADLWSSANLMSYLAITGHWLAQNQTTKRFELRSALLAFHPTSGHSGVSLANVTLMLLDRAGIGHWTMDNASNNKTFLQSLANQLEARGITFDAEDSRISCFPHVINLCSQSVISACTSTQFIDCDYTVPSTASARDPIAIVRQLIKSIRASGQRRQAFDDMVSKGNELGIFKVKGNVVVVPARQLLRDVRTRWDSTYKMVVRIRELRPAVELFLATSQWPELKEFQLSDEEWDKLQEVESLLAIPHQVQMRLCSEKTPVLCGVVPALETFMSAWEAFIRVAPSLEPRIKPGLAIAQKYYCRMDMTKAYVIAMFINPCIRMDWINNHWDQSYKDAARDQIKEKLREYELRLDPEQGRPLPSPVGAKQGSATYAVPADFLKKHGLEDMALFKTGGQVSHSRGVENEFSGYISQISGDVEIIDFWNTHATVFPIIFEMVKDYVAIQASSVPCERVFSSCAETDTKRRNRLSPDILEILQLYKYLLKRDRLDFTQHIATPENDMMAGGYVSPFTDRLSALACRETPRDGNDQVDEFILELMAEDEDT